MESESICVVCLARDQRCHVPVLGFPVHSVKENITLSSHSTLWVFDLWMIRGARMEL